MAGPEAAALAQADGRELRAASIAPTSSAGRQLPGRPPTSGGRPSRERTATWSASGGVAMATARAPRGGGLCDSLGLRARRGQGSGCAGGAAGSPMGLSRSKHKPEKGKGEEQKKWCTSSVPQRKGRSMDRHSQESERPADGFSPKKGTAQHQWLPCEVQGLTSSCNP
ncbi:spermatogenesis associated 33 [Rhinolophus ferrumequinum]|uniref:Spermatogenesis associated 33 n=1 Tax=Rhinolophus ferrumequinum TaxID=59479 RepID=A0A7J7SL34_RHIFE|nr:spermatogenesis associated 33 [Rhinolophus ferrumequinum]